MGRGSLAGLGLVLVAACGPSMPSTEPSERPRTAEVSVRVEKAADRSLEFFAREYAVEASLDSGEQYAWRFGEPGGSGFVPAGTGRVDVRTVVYGDTLECVTDPATATESCAPPKIGEGERCSLDVVLGPSAPVRLLFRLLPNERCQLGVDPQAPGGSAPSGSVPGDSGSVPRA